MPCFMLDGTPKKDGFIAVRARRHLQRYPKVSRGLAGAVFSRQGAGYPPPLRSPCHRATKPDLTPGFAVLPPHSWGGLGWGGFALRTDWPVAVPKSGKDGFSSDAHQRFKVPGGEIHATKLDLTPGFPLWRLKARPPTEEEAATDSFISFRTFKGTPTRTRKPMLSSSALPQDGADQTDPGKLGGVSHVAYRRGSRVTFRKNMNNAERGLSTLVEPDQRRLQPRTPLSKRSKTTPHR